MSLPCPTPPRQNIKQFFLAVLVGVCAAQSAFISAARAQDAPPPPPAAAPTAVGANGDAAGDTTAGVETNAGNTLDHALRRISHFSGATIVAEHALGAMTVTPPEKKTTAQNFEDQLDALVAQLPKGTAWAKLYLPAPPPNGYDGDILAEYGLAAAKLFGSVGDATSAGTVEVMGQKLTADKAAAVVAALNLKPVYILANPNSPPKVADDGNGALPAKQWSALTADQKQQYAQQQAQKLMAMDPAQRDQAMYQMFDQAGNVAKALMQSLSPQDQRAFMMTIASSLGFGGRSGGN